VTPERFPELFYFVDEFGLHPIPIIIIRVKTQASYHGWCATDPFISSPHITLIYNPVAGRLRGKGRDRLGRAEKILADAGYAVSMRPTTAPGAAGDMARKAIAEGTQLILAAGGDGTINEVLDGMAHASVPLGILPAGTANVLATEVGLGSDLERAAGLIPHCSARRIAIGRLDCGSTPRHFLSMAGAGFDARIVYHLSAGLKQRLGKAAYWIGGFAQAVRRYPEFEIEIDGRAQGICSFALASRVRNYGGDFEIARRASLLDNHLEVVLFRGRHALPYLKYLGGMIAGQLAGMQGVTFLTAHHVRVFDSRDRRVYIQVDGEYAGRLPAEISLAPEALTLLVPPAYLLGRRDIPAAAG
jgi:YegS/Rv2252/BmrU family lipid kinase